MNVRRFELPTGCPECVSGISCAEFGSHVLSLVRVHVDHDGNKSAVPHPYDNSFAQMASNLVARLSICPMFAAPVQKEDKE